MNSLDYIVLFGTLLGIAGYGMWRTRGRRDLNRYLRGDGRARWFVIGLSVMATQASAVTFLSTPGQGYQDGLGFVQNYFGAPFALILIAAVFLPIYRRLNIFTAYEYLGRRFDGKTRLLGAALFLLQRGIGAALTIYAPAIVLSTVFGWSLSLTIILSGLVVIAYTVAGGSEAVTLTQKYQLTVIFAGMAAAFFILLAKLPAGLGWSDALALAGHFGRMKAVDYSLNLQPRYTFWSGLLGGFFLALSYFGTDQSQVQRYVSGASLRECRLGLMFNAVWKIPMQFFILLLGVLIFVFYQFERPPLVFDRSALTALQQSAPEQLNALQAGWAKAQDNEASALHQWVDARHAGDASAEQTAWTAANTAHQQADAIHQQAVTALKSLDSHKTANDGDYVFITFILDYLPHGVIGLLVTAFFAAALNSKAAELNALGSTTTVDLYRPLFKRDADDAHYVAASKWFTAFWGVVAIAFALGMRLAENLIQFQNIIGSIFYGVILGMFVIAFFLRKIGGTAVFVAAVLAQGMIIAMYLLHTTVPALDFSYLWYNVIGCAACVLFSLVIQAMMGFPAAQPPESAAA